MNTDIPTADNATEEPTRLVEARDLVCGMVFINREGRFEVTGGRLDRDPERLGTEWCEYRARNVQTGEKVTIAFVSAEQVRIIDRPVTRVKLTAQQTFVYEADFDLEVLESLAGRTLASYSGNLDAFARAVHRGVTALPHDEQLPFWDAMEDTGRQGDYRMTAKAI